jgi:hypothetical protein
MAVPVFAAGAGGKVLPWLGRSAAIFQGWQQLHDSYINGYPDRNAMGLITPARIQVKLLKPDLALALTWWSVTFPSSKKKAVGNTTMNLQKFDDGWKIVASHTATAEM